LRKIAKVRFNRMKEHSMSKLSISAALIALGMACTPAWADSVPWGYSASDAQIYNSNNASKTSSINFAGKSGVASGSSGIIVYQVTASSSASSAGPDSFSNVPFNLAFKLTDVMATGSKSANAQVSETIKVAGLFSASNVTKNSLLPGGNPWSGPVTTDVVLGGDDVGWRAYHVVFSNFTAPGQPGGSPGSIQAIVTIAPAERPGGQAEHPPVPPTSEGPHAAPEPATLLLAATGALPLLIAIRRRRAASKRLIRARE
jgi:hypothetical protein